MGWFKSEVNEEERAKCIAYLKEVCKLRAFYEREMGIHDDTIKQGLGALQDDSRQTGVLEKATYLAITRLSKAANEIITRRGRLEPVPDVVRSIFDAWGLEYSALLEWATAQKYVEEGQQDLGGASAMSLIEGDILETQRERLKTAHNLMQKNDKYWHKAIKTERKLYRQLRLTREEVDDLDKSWENARIKVEAENWQPQE